MSLVSDKKEPEQVKTKIDIGAKEDSRKPKVEEKLKVEQQDKTKSPEERKKKGHENAQVTCTMNESRGTTNRDTHLFNN